MIIYRNCIVEKLDYKKRFFYTHNTAIELCFLSQNFKNDEVILNSVQLGSHNGIKSIRLTVGTTIEIEKDKSNFHIERSKAENISENSEEDGTNY